jgi:hypothetical protein
VAKGGNASRANRAVKGMVVVKVWSMTAGGSAIRKPRKASTFWRTGRLRTRL